MVNVLIGNLPHLPDIGDRCVLQLAQVLLVLCDFVFQTETQIRHVFAGLICNQLKKFLRISKQ